MNAARRSVPDAARPLRAAATFDLAVCVGDGVRGLSRVVNVLALLEITPLELSAAAGPDVLEVRASLMADGRSARLGLERLRALPCVRNAQLSPRTGEATASLARFC
ncbi:hypothetical protein LJR225_005283 [Phenylobacterium sp. LjRoot225]|uniref:hypothetical protein n=1 Tax=Phenylobacterium sp. LjRoot225 TaxID=3342285 RepID=UPI003ECC2481